MSQVGWLTTFSVLRVKKNTHGEWFCCVKNIYNWLELESERENGKTVRGKKTHTHQKKRRRMLSQEYTLVWIFLTVWKVKVVSIRNTNCVVSCKLFFIMGARALTLSLVLLLKVGWENLGWSGKLTGNNTEKELFSRTLNRVESEVH